MVRVFAPDPQEELTKGLNKSLLENNHVVFYSVDNYSPGGAAVTHYLNHAQMDNATSQEGLSTMHVMGSVSYQAQVVFCRHQWTAA